MWKVLDLRESDIENIRYRHQHVTCQAVSESHYRVTSGPMNIINMYLIYNLFNLTLILSDCRKSNFKVKIIESFIHIVP
jgi:hypothetical protein